MRGMHEQGYPESADSQSASADLTVGGLARTPLQIADRPPMTGLQKLFSFLFYGQLLVQLAACASVLSTQTTYHTSPALAECGRFEWAADHELCIEPGLKKRLDACVAALPLKESETDAEGSSDAAAWRRRLSKQPKRPRPDVSLGGRNSGLLLALLAGTALVCLAWFMLLGVFARAMTWGVVVFNVWLMCYMWFLTSNWMLLVTAAVVVVVAYAARAKIEIACQAMGLATEALWSSPWAFAVCFAFRIGWFIYAVSLTYVGCFVSNSKTLGPDCDLVPSWAAVFMSACCPACLMLTTLFMKGCMLSVVTMSVGCWYFPDAAAELEEEACGNPALYGGKLALTTSSGSVFGSALIMGAVEAFKTEADSPCWWMDPSSCALKAFSVVLEGTVGALTRFALIAHLFHGGGLCHMGTITKELLSRHLPDAVATGFLANVIMNQIAMGLATGFGFLVWFLLDQREHIGVFQTIADMVVQNTDSADNFRSSQLLVALLTWSMYLGARKPIQTLFWSLAFQIIAGFVDWLFGTPGLLESYLTAQFMAALSAIIFTYMGSVLEYATDTVFYCMAVECESGRCDARTVHLHESMQKQLGEEEEAAEPNWDGRHGRDGGA